MTPFLCLWRLFAAAPASGPGRICCRLSPIIAACLLALPLPASTFLVDASTSPTGADRLYLSASPLTPAPVNYRVWFVADQTGNGVPTAPPANAILGADDVLLHTDTIDGGLLGDQPGRYSRNSIVVNDLFVGAHVYLYLWNVAAPAIVGVAGQQFGLRDLGLISAPAVGMGNALWVITGPVYADQHILAGDAPLAVPEPSTVWLWAAAAGMVWWRRRRRTAG